MYNVSQYSWGRDKYSLGVFVKDPKTKKLSIQLIKKDIEISYMKFFTMDPSGRFILAGTDKAYQIWTTSGELITKDMFSTQIKCVQFRPRYAIKLSA